MATDTRPRAVGVAIGAVLLFAVPALIGHRIASRDVAMDPRRFGEKVLEPAPTVRDSEPFEDFATPPTIPPLEPPDFSFPEPSNAETFEVPTVLEMRADSATLALELDGLTVVTVFVDVEAGDPRGGRVMTMIPPAGTTVAAGQTIFLTVGRAAP